MKNRIHNVIKVLPFFVIIAAFAIVGTGAKSAAEWPGASCKEAAGKRVSILQQTVDGNALGIRPEVSAPGSKHQK